MNITGSNVLGFNSSLPRRCYNISGNVACSRPGTEKLGLYLDLKPMFNTLAYVLLMLALLGNFLVIVIVFTDRQNRNMANLFLFNIALADILYAGVNIVGEIVTLTNDSKTLHETCILQPIASFRFITYAVSMFSMMALSVERCLAISSPHDSYMNIDNRDNIKISILVVVWLASVAVSLPLALCNFRINTAYIVNLVIILHSLPLIVISISNVLLFKSVKNRVAPAPAEVEVCPSISMLLVALIITLVVFWTPYHVCVMYPVFSRTSVTVVENLKFMIAARAADILAYLNPVLNPVLYGVFTNNFRLGFKRVFVFCFPCCFCDAN